uniref:Late embryogenesis abundant protein LEA-2 subgroup domain-containing protein n=1 Tax=Oryza brachyantha TaxID=4533 RepID=J3LRU1_ORYBR
RLTSGGGRVRARAVSYIDADLSLDGISVVEDAIYLLEDLARGSIPFDTVAEVEGHVRLFFLRIPVKGRISCVVHINPHNQTIVHQDCYPE